MPRLLIAKPGQPPRELTVSGPLIGIGRDARNEVCLTDPDHYVSRYHAVLVRMSGAPEHYFIRDLSSVSGILVNGAGAYQRVLADGDSIHIAGYELAYALETTPAIQRSRLRVVASKSSSDAGAATALMPRVGSRLRAGNDADRDEILNEILLRTAHLHDTGAVLERLMPALVRVMSADRGFAGLFAGLSEEYEEVGATGMQADDQIEIEDPYAMRALLEGKPVREETTLLTPIRRGQRTIGFFCLDRHRPAPSFTDDDGAFLTGLSQLVVPGSVATASTAASEPPIVWPSLFVGRSKQIMPLLEGARDAAASGNVLILGENGSGKELVANTVHQFSRNRAGPFLARNCAALPETLAESELFGYAARSGIANADVHGAPGWFEQANRGSLFLDEVHALSPAIQDKLLRVLEDREVWRIGARMPVKVDVVVISATDKDLAASVESGLFRRALYHRFARRLQVPPLRERREDIRLLAHYFIDKFAAERGGKTRVISQRALEELMNYHWPGNVRELQNCIGNCLSHAGEILFSWDLPAEVRAPRTSSEEPATRSDKPAGTIVPMEEVEREKIGEALRSTRGNITRASQLLGYKSRQTMLNKMDHYGIPRDYGDTSATG